MKQKFLRLISIGAIIFTVFLFLGTNAQATSVYGALFETGHLEATEGTNNEALLMYYPGEDGFIAVTANDTASEWWVSDSLGMNWALVEPSPLAEYECVQAGRHTYLTYNEENYFAVNCGPVDDRKGYIFKLTSSTTVEVSHIYDSLEVGVASAYPTASVLNNKIYMFFNGGFSEFDGTNWTDVFDAPGQTMGVPLEASTEQDGYIYLAQTSGEVQRFDGTSYETIGEGYLEGLEVNQENNLPAIEIFNNTVYVGNADFTNGASLFRYVSDLNWVEALQLSAEDRIINKMQLSNAIDGNQYLVFYTSNSNTGTNIYAVDQSDNLNQLIDSGLGGTNPENNNEVVSIVNRTVIDGNQTKEIMLFATQNMTDQTKIFVLNLDNDLAINPSSGSVISSVKKAYSQAGRPFIYKIKKAQVKKGATYSLWVKGKKVDEKVATTKKKITLKYKAAKNKAVGKTFSVRIGAQYSYGQGNDQIKANNIIKGQALKVTIQ